MYLLHYSLNKIVFLIVICVIWDNNVIGKEWYLTISFINQDLSNKVLKEF